MFESVWRRKRLVTYNTKGVWSIINGEINESYKMPTASNNTKCTRDAYKTSLRLQTIANKLRNIQHSVVEWNLVAVITLGEEQTTEQKLKAQLHNY